ncbi:dTDP-glucose 4,6-dehydratase [Sphingobium limneticum]|uniref:dTDP-glucose 4,6-dehydratase n=1 Tax=Sphingobium limneticum TaxID=1007511 RepID=UPI0024AEAABE|nr:GDP-mannose 4,6-dehydratase [Sphingobium limneticum]
MRVIITGGAGFIGSALVRYLVLDKGYDVLTIDALTYAGCRASLKAVDGKQNHRLLNANICDRSAMDAAIAEFRPDRIMHLAAESHVDRSITGAADFIQTNVVGSFTLLEAARGYWNDLEGAAKAAFRFLHVSTDEVYGSLGDEGLFEETTPYDPSSPYSASKAASDHLAKAWKRTYGLPYGAAIWMRSFRQSG